MLDPGRVDDSRRRVEAVAIKARGGLVESRVVENRGERALLEVAADDRHRVDRGRGRNAEVAQWRDQASAGGVLEREVVDRSREDVRDLLRDQLLRRGHPDVDGLREGRIAALVFSPSAVCASSAITSWYVSRLTLAVMPGEPGIGLHGDRARLRRRLPLLDHGREPIAVALGSKLPVELRDEQAAMREDEDAHRARGLDEPGGGDRLARRGWMAEPVAPDRSGVLGRRELFGQRLQILVDELLELLLFFVELGRLASPLPFTGSSARWFAAISSVSMPASASIWWRRSSVPDARRGGFSDSTRSSPSMSAKRTFHSDEGASRPASISAVASSRALRRAVPCGENRGRLLAVVKERLARPVGGALGCGDEVVVAGVGASCSVVSCM